MSRLWVFTLGLALFVGCENPEVDPDTWENSMALLTAGEIASAEGQTRRLIRSNPENPDLRLLLGDIYLAAGDGAAALSAFERAGALGATGPGLREVLVRSLILVGDYGGVLQLLPMDNCEQTYGIAGRRGTGRTPPQVHICLQHVLQQNLASDIYP